MSSSCLFKDQVQQCNTPAGFLFLSLFKSVFLQFKSGTYWFHVEIYESFHSDIRCLCFHSLCLCSNWGLVLVVCCSNRLPAFRQIEWPQSHRGCWSMHRCGCQCQCSHNVIKKTFPDWPIVSWDPRTLHESFAPFHFWLFLNFRKVTQKGLGGWELHMIQRQARQSAEMVILTAGDLNIKCMRHLRAGLKQKQYYCLTRGPQKYRAWD